MKIRPAKIYFPKNDRREVLDRIDECLRTGSLTLGKNGRELEERLAQYVGTKYAIAVNNGTSSLEIPLRILGVQGKTVLVPTNTFFATPAAVLHAGGKARFVDADSKTFSLDVESLRWSIPFEKFNKMLDVSENLRSHQATQQPDIEFFFIYRSATN